MLKSEIIAFVGEVQINKKEGGGFLYKFGTNIGEKWQEPDSNKVSADHCCFFCLPYMYLSLFLSGWWILHSSSVSRLLGNQWWHPSSPHPILHFLGMVSAPQRSNCHWHPTGRLSCVRDKHKANWHCLLHTAAANAKIWLGWGWCRYFWKGKNSKS